MEGIVTIEVQIVVDSSLWDCLVEERHRYSLAAKAEELEKKWDSQQQLFCYVQDKSHAPSKAILDLQEDMVQDEYEQWSQTLHLPRAVHQE